MALEWLMRAWELGPGRLMVDGVFSDLALHHHPAVQITFGGQGSLAVTRDDDTNDVCRVVLSRQADLPHGYLNFVGLGGRFAEAASEAAGALRLGLAKSVGSASQRGAGEFVGVGDIP